MKLFMVRTYIGYSLTFGATMRSITAFRPNAGKPPKKCAARD